MSLVVCLGVFVQAPSQNVGIGTNTPVARLHIEVSSSFSQPVVQVNQQGSATPYFIILPNGNVGIGVATPSEALDVNGNVQFSGALMPGGNPGTAGQVLVSQGPGTAPQWVNSASIGDNWGSQVAQTQAPIVGDGTAGSPIGLQSGTSAGDVFIYDGSTWVIKQAPWDSVCNTVASNMVQKWTGTELCNSQIYDDGTNVGIGTMTPTEKLDVVGNVQFSGALMPGGNAGSAGQVLVSQGPGTAPVWSTPKRSDSVCTAVITNFVQKWTGTSLCNTSIYDSAGYVGIHTQTPQARVDISDTMVVGVKGNLPNGISAELHIGRQIAPPLSTGEVNRIAIQPYGNTGGPYLFVSRDTGIASFLDIRYDSFNIISIARYGNPVNYIGVGIGNESRFPVTTLDVLQKTNSIVGDRSTLIARFGVVDSASKEVSSIQIYGYTNPVGRYLDSTIMFYTAVASATKNINFVVGRHYGSVRFNFGLPVDSSSEVMLIRRSGVGIRTQYLREALNVNGDLEVRRSMPLDGLQSSVGVALANIIGDTLPNHTWRIFNGDPDGGYGVYPYAFEIWEYPESLTIAGLVTGSFCCRRRFVILSTRQNSNQPRAVTIDQQGYLGLGWWTPPSTGFTNIITVRQGSITDPIADSWTVYSTRETKEEVLGSVSSDDLKKYLKYFRDMPVYKWRRTKGEQVRLSPMADDEGVPGEIRAYDSEGNVQGIDLYGYIGFLHVVMKGMYETMEQQSSVISRQQKIIKQLEQRISELEEQVGR